jgi:acyl-CoA dehydrogenase
MTFDLTPTAAQHDLARRTHEFAESVMRPVALDYDQRQEFPWPCWRRRPSGASTARCFIAT